jgi:hypothetical protein
MLRKGRARPRRDQVLRRRSGDRSSSRVRARRSSAAIQRVIAERDRHKSLAAAQESELIRLRAINEELRRQNEEISVARERYLGLAAELLAQLQQVDTAIHDALQKSRDDSESGDAAIISLARRFSPKGTLADGTADY